MDADAVRDEPLAGAFFAAVDAAAVMDRHRRMARSSSYTLAHLFEELTPRLVLHRTSRSRRPGGASCPHRFLAEGVLTVSDDVSGVTILAR